jgi:hypothetical protein
VPFTDTDRSVTARINGSCGGQCGKGRRDCFVPPPGTDSPHRGQEVAGSRPVSRSEAGRPRWPARLSREHRGKRGHRRVRYPRGDRVTALKSCVQRADRCTADGGSLLPSRDAASSTTGDRRATARPARDHAPDRTRRRRVPPPRPMRWSHRGSIRTGGSSTAIGSGGSTACTTARVRRCRESRTPWWRRSPALPSRTSAFVDGIRARFGHARVRTNLAIPVDHAARAQLTDALTAEGTVQVCRLASTTLACRRVRRHPGCRRPALPTVIRGVTQGPLPSVLLAPWPVAVRLCRAERWVVAAMALEGACTTCS